VDDAGGGRRGSRAVVSRELWEVLVSRWAIPRQHGRDLGGSLNLNLLVSRGDDQLVVRVHRPPVRPARLQDIQAVRDRLDSAGVPCAALVPARDGARWSQAAGQLFEVERFVPHDGRMNTPQRLASGLPIPGRIHALLADLAVSPAGRTAEFANHIEPGRVLAGTRAGPDQALAADAVRAADGQPGEAARRASHSRRGRPGGRAAAAAGARRLLG
jgi:Ser/Thr protein kinase RdoA (MazF antagonist)